MFLTIIDMLNSKLFSQREISQKINASGSVVSHINTGKYQKFKYPPNTTFPIYPQKTVNDGILPAEKTITILIEYIDTDISRKALAQKYDITEAYIKGIITCYKPYLLDLTRPIRNNKEKNIVLLKEKLKTIQKYK